MSSEDDLDDFPVCDDCGYTVGIGAYCCEKSKARGLQWCREELEKCSDNARKRAYLERALARAEKMTTTVKNGDGTNSG